MTQPTFLVVEDEKDQNALLCSMLEALGCKTVPALTGEEAISFLENLDDALALDAIFLDIFLPGINGIDILRELKERMYTREIPVIIISAKSEKDDLLNGYNTGADYFIPKPFTMQQLTYALDLVLGQYREAENDDVEV